MINNRFCFGCEKSTGDELIERVGIATLWHHDGEERPAKFYTIPSPWYNKERSAIGESFRRDDTSQLLRDIFAKLNLMTVDDLDTDSANNWYFDIFDEAKDSPIYNLLLIALINQPILMQEAFLKYLSFQDYDSTDDCESNFLLGVLNKNNVTLQEDALNVLLEWGTFPDKEALENITIDNKILMHRLARFINGE